MTSKPLTIDSCCIFENPPRSVARVIHEFTTDFRVDTFMAAARAAVNTGTTHFVETGCYRGTPADGCSTIILATLAREVGGMLDCYELQPSNIQFCSKFLKKHGLAEYVRFHQGDSINNLATRTEPIGFAYLDSFDCGSENHRASQEHQLAEVEAILPLLETRAAILMDDHVEPKGGKTRLSIKRLSRRGFKNVAYQYQVLFVSDDTRNIRPCRFAVLCCHSPEFVPLAARTIYKNKAIYAVSHGYDLWIDRWIHAEFKDPNSAFSGFSWSRMRTMVNLVECGRYEWVWCVGADTMITNMTVSLESIVDDLPKTKHVAICGERIAPIQADSFLIRCSKEGADYLKDILAHHEDYKHHPWSENQAMIDLRDKHAAVTQIIPQHRLNSYQYDLYKEYAGDSHVYDCGLDCYGNRGQWQEGDFIVHWAGIGFNKRIELMQKYEPKVIKPRMKIILVYTHILGKCDPTSDPADYYVPGAERFLKTYQQFKPDIPHELVVVNCNPGESNGMFEGVATDFLRYYGAGWDCGAFQWAANTLDCELMVCLNAFTFFWRKGWLEAFISSAQFNGPGVYGATASFETKPHLRAPCFATDPGILRLYPIVVNDRKTAENFEAGEQSFTLWAHKEGYPTLLVAADGVYGMNDWRKGNNIFRRGDQSNCLILDRHTELYRLADAAEKKRLENLADTWG